MTTAEDMARWLINFGTARLGGTNAIQRMQQPGRLNSGATVDYGFGLGLDTYRGLKNVYHTGSWAGDCAMTWFPERRLGVAVFANAPGTNPERIAYDIANIYLDHTEPAKPKPTVARGALEANHTPPVLTSEQLAAYVGDYWSEELQVMYSVRIQNGELTVGHRFSGLGKLRPTGLDRFNSDSRKGVPVASIIEFTRDPASAVNGMKVTGGRVRHLQFTRVTVTKTEATAR